MRDLFRRGEKQPGIDRPKKTQEQLRAMVERQKAIMDKMSALPYGNIPLTIPEGLEHPDDAEGMVLKKVEELSTIRNPEGSSTTKTETSTTIAFQTNRVEQRDDGGLVTVKSEKLLYKITAGNITEYVTDPKGVTLTDVDTPEFVDLETILTQAAIQAELDKPSPEDE